MNLILVVFRGPFWVQFVLAAGVIWFGYFVQQDEAARQVARAALLEQAPPGTISVADFKSDAPGRAPVELSVTAQVALDHNTRLVRKTNFIKTGEDLLYVLVDPAPDADPNVAIAGIVLNPDQLDAFTEWLILRSTGFGEAGPIATIDGLLTSSSNASHALKAMKNQGMTIAKDFYFIEPFIVGREASLTAIPEKATQISWPIYGLAAFIALVGIFKMRGIRSKSATPKPATAAATLADDPVHKGRGLGACIAEELSAARMLSPEIGNRHAATANSAKAPKSKVTKLVWLAALGLVIALGTGQTWAYGAMPLLIFGLMYLGLRKGLRQVSEGIESVIANFTGKEAKPSVMTAMPRATSVQTAFSVPTFAASLVKSKPADGGPIRAGFSWKDLIPKPRQKAAPGSDPFDRIARQRQQEQAAAQRQ